MVFTKLKKPDPDIRFLGEVADKNPSTIWVEPTNRCNARCVHCRHGYETFGQDMAPDIYRKVREALLDDVKEAYLLGYGEPLLAPIFNEMFDECRRRGIRVMTVTNGILLNSEEAVAKVVREGALLVVSIDGARAETFERIRRGVKWTRMIETLDRIKRAAETGKRVARRGPPESQEAQEAQGAAGHFTLRFNFVPMKQNIAELPDLVRLAAKYGASEICVLPLAGDEHNENLRGQSLHDSPELVSPAFLEALSLAARLNIHLMTPVSFRELILDGPERGRGLRGKALRALRRFRLAGMYFRRRGLAQTLGRIAYGSGPRAKSGAAFCALPWQASYFAADGKVFPCCVMGEVLGDLSGQEWRDIWNGPLYRNLRRTIHSWNPSRVCRLCALPPGINGGDERRYEKFFSRFRREVIPLDAAGVHFGEGFYGLERGADGSPHHHWMGRRGTLRLPMKRGARFLRLLISPRFPIAETIGGLCRINGGPPEPFDNTCPELTFPLDHARGNGIEARLEMEKSFRVEGDPRDLAMAIMAVEYLL